MTTMGISYLSFVENKRSNLAKEAETARHNVKTEDLGSLQFGETVRSNLANESLKKGSLDESIRSNLANEGIKLATLSETVRSNKASESIGLQNLAESVRSNTAREKENVRTNLARELETNRSNVANELERERINSLGMISKVSEGAAALKASEKTPLNAGEWMVFGADTAMKAYERQAAVLKDNTTSLRNLGIKIPNL